MNDVKRVFVSDTMFIGGNSKRFTLIAGPCVIENEDMCFKIASKVKDICDEMDIGFIFKASFDKANRSSIDSPRGVGLEEGLNILKRIRSDLNIPVITDVHESWQCSLVGNVVDVIQIPAFLCRQTDLLIAAAKTGKVINVKKGQFLAPWEMNNVIKKIEEAGNDKILVCERGSSFGYNNLVVDMTGLITMRKLGYPVVFDATHSVQKPGGKGLTSDGKREFVPILMRAALAVGVDAIFAEVHPDPENALSDGPNQIHLDDLKKILLEAVKVDDVIKRLVNEG